MTVKEIASCRGRHAVRHVNPVTYSAGVDVPRGSRLRHKNSYATEPGFNRGRVDSVPLVRGPQFSRHPTRRRLHRITLDRLLFAPFKTDVKYERCTKQQ